MQITTIGNGFAITLGWVLALLILLLVIVFLVIGGPTDPKIVLLLIGGLALARLI